MPLLLRPDNERVHLVPTSKIKLVQRGPLRTRLLLLRLGVRRRFRWDARTAGIARRYLPIISRLLPDVDDEKITAYVLALEAGLLLIEKAYDSGLPELAHGQARHAIRADAIGGDGGFQPFVTQR